MKRVPFRLNAAAAIVACAIAAGAFGEASAATPPPPGPPPFPPDPGTNAPQSPTWMNVTGNVGDKKFGYNGVCLLSVVPNSSQVIAGVSERGLWSTTDGGTTWTHLGDADRDQVTNRTHQVLYDPKDPKTFWVSGNYGAGVFKTIDGGKTFQRLGNLQHVDGLAIDFTDPDRKTMLCGLHEQVQSLQLSTDGGKTWEKIGDRLPAKTNFTSDPIILDSKTFLVNTAGWAQNASWGIYRSEDAGKTWNKVSELGPAGPALVTPKGEIYWSTLWQGQIIKSTDGGKTWTKVDGPVRGQLTQLPDGALLGVGDRQVYVSKDDAKTWAAVGAALPFKPSGAVYSSGEQAVYVWRTSEKTIPDAIFRLVVGGTL